MVSSSLVSSCEVPYATPDDGVDDRAAIQNALTLQGCAHLLAGTYDIDSIPFTPPARRPYMMLTVAGAELYGEGQGATVLAFRGANGGQDWEGVRITGSGARLHDLTVRTAGISGTNEQTHAVKLMGPAADVEVTRVTFDHPIHVDEKSGDCIQFVAYNDGRQITNVNIHDNEFLRCDRSGVGVHSGTTKLSITDNRFGEIGNTDLDFEGTGDTSEVSIRHNIFTMSAGPHGVGSIQLQLVDKVQVTDNVFSGRGIDVYQSDDVEIDHNMITMTQTSGVAVIAVTKDSSRTLIHHNVIERSASAGPGAVIRAMPHGTGTPDHLTVADNTLVQRTDGHVIETSGLVGLYVRHNNITFSGATNIWSGVLANGSTSIRTDDIVLDTNSWNGPLRQVLAVSGSYAGCGSVTLLDNTATGPVKGLFCAGVSTGAGVIGPVVSTRDLWPTPVCGPPGFVL